MIFLKPIPHSGITANITLQREHHNIQIYQYDEKENRE